MNDSPIESYLDEVLTRARTDARSARRLLDETAEHLMSAAADLEQSGMSRFEAESQAVRQFGPVSGLTRPAARHSLGALVVETTRAAVLLAGCGLVAVGGSGLVALVMNIVAGRSFVGGRTVFTSGSASAAEVADDAVTLRVLAGLVGLIVLLGYAAWRRRVRTDQPLLPPGLVDALGAAAFAAATVGLGAVCIDQAVQTGTRGIGFSLSGVLVAAPATVWFCTRAANTVLTHRFAHQAHTEH